MLTQTTIATTGTKPTEAAKPAAEVVAKPQARKFAADKVVLSGKAGLGAAKAAEQPGLLARGKRFVSQAIEDLSTTIDTFLANMIFGRMLRASKEEQADREKAEIKQQNERMYWAYSESVAISRRAEVEAAYERRRNQG